MSLVPKQRVVVKLKNNSGLLQQASGSGASVKSTTLVSIGSSGINRLDLLQDVIEGTPTTGDVLTYDSTVDKYRVSPPKGNFDGGFF